MRILYVLEYYHPHIGGVETLFRSLAEQMDSEGHEVTILTNRYDAALPSRETFGQRGEIIRRRYYNRYLFTFFAWISAISLARKADIIHTTSYNAAIPARIAAWITGTRSIITFHEVYGELWYEVPWMSRLARWLHRTFESGILRLSFDRFVGVSDFTRDRLVDHGVDATRAMRIYNGIDYSDFPTHRSVDDGMFTFLFFGRVGYAKGVDVLLRAYQLFLQSEKDQRHRLQMIIPSEQTPLSAIAFEMIRDLKLENHIEISHDLSYTELKTAIAQADAVVVPSYSEGFCFAAVETMAMGTPIVSSGRGALAEVVSGTYINSPALTAEDMAKSMSAAFHDQWEIQPLKKFYLSETIKQYSQVYDELVSQ